MSSNRHRCQLALNVNSNIHKIDPVTVRFVSMKFLGFPNLYWLSYTCVIMFPQNCLIKYGF